MQQCRGQRDLVVAMGVCKQWHFVGGDLLPLLALSGGYGGIPLRLSLPQQHGPRATLLEYAPQNWVRHGQGRLLELWDADHGHHHTLERHLRALVCVERSPISEMILQGTQVVLHNLLAGPLAEHVSTSSTVEMEVDKEEEHTDEEGPPPLPPPNPLTLLSTSHTHLTGLRLTSYKTLLDLGLVAAMTNLTTLFLKGMCVKHADVVALKLPQLTNLSLINIQVDGDHQDGRSMFLKNHQLQLQHLQLVDLREGQNTDGLYAEKKALSRCKNLTSLDVLHVLHSNVFNSTIRNLPSLGFLAIDALEGDKGIKPTLTRIRTLVASGTIVSDALTHFEYIKTCRHEPYGGPLLLPTSITTAYLPVPEFPAIQACSRLESLSLYIPRARLGQAATQSPGGLWPNLRRLALAPLCDWFSSWDMRAARDDDDLNVLQKILDVSPPRPLTHLTIVLRGENTVHLRLFTALQGIVTLRNLLLVNLTVGAARLEEVLVSLPDLELIELVAVKGVTEQDCLRLSTPARTVTHVPSMQMFRHSWDAARFA